LSIRSKYHQLMHSSPWDNNVTLRVPYPSTVWSIPISNLDSLSSVIYITIAFKKQIRCSFYPACPIECMTCLQDPIKKIRRIITNQSRPYFSQFATPTPFESDLVFHFLNSIHFQLLERIP
jgi:hypothetical protein